MVVKMVVRPIAKLSEEARCYEQLVLSFDVLTNSFRPSSAAIWQQTCAAVLCLDAAWATGLLRWTH
jgi:hypothetical protein